MFQQSGDADYLNSQNQILYPKTLLSLYFTFVNKLTDWLHYF